MNIITYVASKMSLVEYYDKSIGPLHLKYSEKSWRSVKVVVCPLHNDHDASFGIMKDRNNRDIMRYHCFGCGKSGNVVNLHQQMTQQRTGKTLTVLEAARELAAMYQIEIDEEALNAIDDSITTYYAERTTVTEDLVANKFRPTVRNYQRNFMKLRKAQEAGMEVTALIQNYDNLNKAYKEASI